MPNNTEKIWLFENEAYYEFELTSASEAFIGLSYDEVYAYLHRENASRREEREALIQKSVANTASMRAIVQNAAALKDSAGSASTLNFIKQAREREELFEDES